jgi:hypothetical protein
VLAAHPLHITGLATETLQNQKTVFVEIALAQTKSDVPSKGRFKLKFNNTGHTGDKENERKILEKLQDVLLSEQDRGVEYDRQGVGVHRARTEEAQGNIGKHNTGTFDDSTRAKNGGATKSTDSPTFSPISEQEGSTSAQEEGYPSHSGRIEGTQQAGTDKTRQVCPGGRFLDFAACGKLTVRDAPGLRGRAMDSQNAEPQNGGPNRTGPVRGLPQRSITQPQGISERIRAWLQSLSISDHHNPDDMAQDERPRLPLAETRGRPASVPTRRPHGTDQAFDFAHV